MGCAMSKVGEECREGWKIGILVSERAISLEKHKIAGGC